MRFARPFEKPMSERNRQTIAPMILAAVKAYLLAIPPAVTTEMVNAVWNEAKTRRMTGLPSDFRAVLEAALSPTPAPKED